MNDKEKKKIITEWFYKNACGYKKIIHRKFILADLTWQIPGLEDRELRKMCADIPEIITSTSGYYVLPLTDPTGVETAIALEYMNQSRRRLVSEYLRGRRNRQAIRKMNDATRQKEINFTEGT